MRDVNAPITLAPARDWEGSVLAPSTAALVLEDTWSEGLTYLCSGCGARLAAGIAADQVWDLAIKCFHCGERSLLPILPTGAPLPPRLVFLPKGLFRLDSTITLNRSMLVGEAAVLRRGREVGLEVTGNYASDIKSTLGRLRSLLGAECNRLRSSYEKGRRSRTPPPTVHRLMPILDTLEALDKVEGDGTGLTVDARHLAEASVLNNIAERWKHHPIWQTVTSAFESEFEHTVILFALAAALEDHGNGVEFVAPKKGTRIPDIKLHAAVQQRLAVEVKVPVELVGEPADMTADEAAAIVEKAFEKAGTGHKGQLAPHTPGMLAIGAFHVTERVIDALRFAAADYFVKNMDRGTLSHIAGLNVFSLMVGDTSTGSTASVGAAMCCRLVRNPGYTGPVPIVVRPANDAN